MSKIVHKENCNLCGGLVHYYEAGEWFKPTTAFATCYGTPNVKHGRQLFQLEQPYPEKKKDK